MKVDVLLGLQWGDEGKGKIVDVLTPRYDIIARFQGGPNAGHTIEFGNKKFILHTIPSGIFNPEKTNLIGNGVIIDPFILQKEIANLAENNIDARSNLVVSRRAHLILPTHRLLDATYETIRGKAKIGSTLKGIGPTYTDKMGRNGIRVGDIGTSAFMDKYEKLKAQHMEIIRFYNFKYFDHLIDKLPFSDYEKHWLEAIEAMKDLRVVDSEIYINQKLGEGKSVLAEGAQGTLLDIDFGSYPYVTSSNTMIGGAVTGLGIPPQKVGDVMGVFKAYCTRVGEGPFPTEDHGDDGETIRREGHEFGSTTGRPRRCGWLDLQALKYAIMINGVNKLFMMKTDVLDSFHGLKIGTGYKQGSKEYDYLPFDLNSGEFEPQYKEFPGWNCSLDKLKDRKELPSQLMDYVKYIESETAVPVKGISYGPDRSQTLFR
jgi:adenylosuccinate synthase